MRSSLQSMVWVDGKGNFIKKMSKDQPVDLDPSVMDDEAKNKAGISSAKLWKRINPGCMTGYMDLPNSTYSRNFKFDDKNKAYIEEDKNWEFHFRKTEISQYTEAAVRHKMTGNI
ncbi:hypothetical protein HKI87_16g82840 [Chloropicon roscoffensis]|uniref:Uncharacterized protein n=1 Tax=Chloropicon roscoffensis TaxID=1461544 RepID=A0AAX4PLB0_9CHLO